MTDDLCRKHALVDKEQLGVFFFFFLLFSIFFFGFWFLVLKILKYNDQFYSSSMSFGAYREFLPISDVVPPLLPYSTTVLLMDADVVQIPHVDHIARKRKLKKSSMSISPHRYRVVHIASQKTGKKKLYVNIPASVPCRKLSNAKARNSMLVSIVSRVVEC